MPDTDLTLPPTTIGRTVVLVRDEDDAAAFYHATFGFTTLHDSTSPTGQRFLHVGPPAALQPPHGPPAGLWLLRAGPDDTALVGRQAGGQPLLVLYTADCRAHCERLRELGVRIVRPPAEGGGALFAHCQDLYGNEIVLVQLAARAGD